MIDEVRINRGDAIAKFPFMLDLDVTGESQIFRTEMPTAIINQYYSFSGRGIEYLARLRAHFEGAEIISPHVLHNHICTFLIYHYSRIMTEHDYFNESEAGPISQDRSVCEFLKEGSFMQMGCNDNVSLVRASFDSSGKCNPKYWAFRDEQGHHTIKPVLMIFNIKIIPYLTEVVKKYVFDNCTGKSKGAITWVIEYGDTAIMMRVADIDFTYCEVNGQSEFGDGNIEVLDFNANWFEECEAYCSKAARKDTFISKSLPSDDLILQYTGPNSCNKFDYAIASLELEADRVKSEKSLRPLNNKFKNMSLSARGKTDESSNPALLLLEIMLRH